MTMAPPGFAPGSFTAPPLVAGIGCTARAGADEIVALMQTCLAELGFSASGLVALASHARKAGHPGLAAAARHFGVPLLLLPPSRLAPGMPTPSSRVEAAVGVPSVAEAAAAACGKLVLQKRRSAQATCAIALASGPAQSSRAAMAPSMLSASSAGP